MKISKNQKNYLSKKTYTLTLVTYLPLTQIKDIIDNEPKVKHYAYCLHDKDKKKNHTHVILNFWTDQTLLKYAKLFDTTEIKVLEKQHVTHMFNYLIHDTESARAEGKYQYSEVERVFDDLSFFKKSARKESVNVVSMIDDVLLMTPRDFVSKYGYNALLNYSRIKEFAEFSSNFD